MLLYYSSSQFNEIRPPDAFLTDLEYVGLKLEYILEKDIIIFSHIREQFIYYIIFPDNMYNIEAGKVNFNPNYRYSILFSNNYTDFCIISNIDDNGENIDIIPLYYKGSIIKQKEEKSKTEQENIEYMGEMKEEEEEKIKEKDIEILEKEGREEKKSKIEKEREKEKEDREEKKSTIENERKENEKIETEEIDKENEVGEKIKTDEKNKGNTIIKIEENEIISEIIKEEEDKVDKNLALILNKINNTSSDDDIISSFQEFIRNEIDIELIKEGKEIIINTEQGNTITFTSTENQKSELNINKTTINLGEYEGSLRKYYNISQNDSLYILKMDIQQKGMNIPKLEYEVYSKLKGDKMIKLNLTICKDKKIELNISVSINDNLEKYN